MDFLGCPCWASTCDSPDTASWCAGISHMHHHAWLTLHIFNQLFINISTYFYCSLGSNTHVIEGPAIIIEYVHILWIIYTSANVYKEQYKNKRGIFTLEITISNTIDRREAPYLICSQEYGSLFFV